MSDPTPQVSRWPLHKSGVSRLTLPFRPSELCHDPRTTFSARQSLGRVFHFLALLSTPFSSLRFKTDVANGFPEVISSIVSLERMISWGWLPGFRFPFVLTIRLLVVSLWAFLSLQLALWLSLKDVNVVILLGGGFFDGGKIVIKMLSEGFNLIKTTLFYVFWGDLFANLDL